MRQLLASKFYFDEIYDALVQFVQGGFAAILRFIDVWILDFFLIRGVISLGTLCAGNLVRCFQTGNLQTYVIFLGVALVAFIYWIVINP